MLISAGKAGWLAVASVAMGWPAFLLLVFFSYRYTPFRLAQLGAPPGPNDLKQLGQLGRRHRAREVEALAAVGPAARRCSSCPAVSIPSTTTSRPSSRPRRSIAAMNAPPRSSSGTPARNERSSLRMWTVRCAQARQRREAGAEVVDRHAHAERADALEHRSDGRGL